MADRQLDRAGGRGREGLTLQAAWTELPELVSLNLSEDGWRELWALVAGRGIGVEARLAGLRPQLHHGMGPATWAVLRAAQGHDTRIGLEDVLTLPGGEPAPGNAGARAYAARGSSST